MKKLRFIKKSIIIAVLAAVLIVQNVSFVYADENSDIVADVEMSEENAVEKEETDDISENIEEDEETDDIPPVEEGDEPISDDPSGSNIDPGIEITDGEINEENDISGNDRPSFNRPNQGTETYTNGSAGSEETAAEEQNSTGSTDTVETKEAQTANTSAVPVVLIIILCALGAAVAAYYIAVVRVRNNKHK